MATRLTEKEDGKGRRRFAVSTMPPIEDGQTWLASGAQQARDR